MDSEDPSTGVRVTRSLRKRLTSVDSDASSRPSTPQLTKLITIPETSSPTRALRGTRRNSTTSSGTPLKTPAKSKTATIHESNEAEIVPAKRTTRKSSICSDLQTALKVSPVDKVPSNVNEIDEMNIKGTPAKRTRRLQSQSEVEKTPRSGAVKKKPGPKSRRQKQESESESDIEVINLEDENTDGKENEISTTSIIKDNLTKTPIRTSPRLKAKSVSPKDTAVVTETIDLLEDTRTPHDTEECDGNGTVSLRTETHENINISDTKTQLINTNEGEGLNLESLNSSKTEDTLVKETDTENNPNKMDSLDHNDVNVDATAKSPNETLSSLNSSKLCVESVVILEKLSPKVLHKICSKRTSISSPSNSKSVTFNDNGVDDEVKSSYPKTPASIKSKSYLAMDSTNESNNQSIQSDKESNNSFKDASENIEISKENNAFGVQANDSKDSVEFHDATNTVEELDNVHEVDEIDEIATEYTPQKKKLSGKLQSSTPMLDSVLNPKTESEKLVINSPVRTNVLEEAVSKLKEVESSPMKQDETTAAIPQHDQKDVEKTNDKRVSLTSADGTLSNNGEKTENLFSKSWTHTVSGCATSDGKIDTLSVSANDEKDDDESLKVVDEQKSSSNVSTYKETPKENDNLEEEEEGEEEEHFQKLEFVDDEAMEVDDNYQSGDSMDEEERKEMMENEILDEGESIGSEDTEESNDENDEENENASFITSDSGESLLEYSDNDEDLENDIKKSHKKNSCNRILITSESEDDSNRIVSTTNSNKRNKSNSRNRILSSSESETEQQATKASELINNSRKNSDNSENPLNLQVSRMIDDTTDDEDNAKESTESQLETKASNNIGSKCSNNQEVEIKDEEDSRDEQETKNEAELNTSQKRNAGSATTKASPINDQCNIVDTIDQKRRHSQLLSKSICENIVENSHDNEENFHVVSKESDKDYTIFRKKTNTLRRSMERRSINCGHDCNKATETIEDADINSTDNKNYPQSDSDSSDNINMQMKADEDPKLNSLEDMQSQNVSKDAKNADDEDIEIPETQEVCEASEEEEEEEDESAIEEAVEDLTVGESTSKLKNSGLSLSFCQTKQKRVTVKDRIRHRSFTIGVSVTKLEEAGSSDSDEKEQCSNSNEIDKQDEEELEKLAHSNVQFFNGNRKRNSMLSTLAQDIQEFPSKKISKRNSLQSISNEGFNPSKSLLEYIEEQNRKLQSQKDGKKTRLSKSFCGPIQDDMETLVESGSDSDVANSTRNDKTNRKSLQNTEQGTHSTASKSRLSKSLCEPIQEVPTTVGDSSRSENSGDEMVNKKVNDSSSRELVTTKNKKRDFGRILDRCDEILDAANHAKLESKQNYKKSRIIIPKSKKESKHSLLSDEESASDTHEFKKDTKHPKEKTTLALEQAFKASANILLREANKVKKEKQSLQKNEEKYADKRLPMQLLESISNSHSHNEIKKSKRERAREPLIQRLNCATGEIVEEVLSPPKKKRAILNKIELPTGTVLEEPVTPKKKKCNSGFRESPITPRTLGFKVRHILTAGQDKVPQLPTSHGIERKRKQKILDPKLVLPKPQWSQSGVFLEEILPSRKMQGMNTMKTCGPGANEATVNALNFKTSTLFRKNVPREASHEILKRKERQYVRSRF